MPSEMHRAVTRRNDLVSRLIQDQPAKVYSWPRGRDTIQAGRFVIRAEGNRLVVRHLFTPEAELHLTATSAVFFGWCMRPPILSLRLAPTAASPAEFAVYTPAEREAALRQLLQAPPSECAEYTPTEREMALRQLLQDASGDPSLLRASPSDPNTNLPRVRSLRECDCALKRPAEANSQNSGLEWR
ncbi:hypothetical protein T484DRAFT_1916839 [Baffinella frigidus]|nr:hypothetical protein T484DRAFT_1916839 [Cryptophyta sp. CCMP2293]